MKILAITLIAAFASSTAMAQQQAPAGNVENGKKRYMSTGCYQCHGVNADGAALTGPKLSRTALPFDAFMTQLRKPSSDMPPYEAAIVPDQEVADIYAFVKSVPASPDAKSLPLLMGMGVK